MSFKMTQEERLALRLKHNDKLNIVLNKYGVRYLIRRLGWSPIKVGRIFPRFTKGGTRELLKWFLVYAFRDLALYAPATIAIIYTIFHQK